MQAEQREKGNEYDFFYFCQKRLRRQNESWVHKSFVSKKVSGQRKILGWVR